MTNGSVRFTSTALQELVAEAMDGMGLDPTPTMAVMPLQANPAVDPTTASDDVDNAGYLPRDKAEFTVAVARLTDDLGDEDVPGLYRHVKAALAAIGKNDDGKETTMKVAPQRNEVANRSAVRRGAQRPAPKGDPKVEEAVRRAVRRMISEAMPGRDLGYSGPDTYALSAYDDDPYKVYSFTPKGTRKPQPDASFDTMKAAQDWVVKLRRKDPQAKYEVVDETSDSGEPEREKGKWSVPKGDDGQEFGDISKDLGMSVMGAQAMAARAMKRFGHLFKMMFGDLEGEGAMPEEAQLMVLTAARDFIAFLNDDKKAAKILAQLSGRDMQTLLPDSIDEYVRYLEGSAELVAADVQLLKDHPSMVAELDGYPEFVRTQLRDELETELAQLPNDVDALTALDGFREFLSDYVKKSYKDWNDDEDA